MTKDPADLGWKARGKTPLRMKLTFGVLFAIAIYGVAATLWDLAT